MYHTNSKKKCFIANIETFFLWFCVNFVMINKNLLVITMVKLPFSSLSSISNVYTLSFHRLSIWITDEYHSSHYRLSSLYIVQNHLQWLSSEDLSSFWFCPIIKFTELLFTIYGTEIQFLQFFVGKYYWFVVFQPLAKVFTWFKLKVRKFNLSEEYQQVMRKALQDVRINATLISPGTNRNIRLTRSTSGTKLIHIRFVQAAQPICFHGVRA